MHEQEPAAGEEGHDYINVSPPEAGKRYYGVLNERSDAFTRTDRVNIERKFNHLPTYLRMIDLAGVLKLADKNASHYFRQEDLDVAIAELEAILEKQGENLGENSTNPYFKYCLNAFRNNLIPMSRGTWADSRNLTKMRHEFDNKTTGNTVNQGEWHTASAQGTEEIETDTSKRKRHE